MGNSISKKKGSSKQKRLSTSSKSNNKSTSLPPQQQSSQAPLPRVDVTNAPDNENSVNTTQSISSILITSSQHRRNVNNNNNNASALSQLNPDYPTGNGSNTNTRNLNNDDYNEQDTIGPGPDPFQGKVEHPQQHKLLAQSDFWPPKKASGQTLDVNNDNLDNNQLTVSSMNQLTVNSVSSMNMQNAPAQIDDYIRRLLDAGYASKVPKHLSLKHSEVNALCRAAMEIFLSQPVSLVFVEEGKRRKRENKSKN